MYDSPWAGRHVAVTAPDLEQSAVRFSNHQHGSAIIPRTLILYAHLTP